MENPQHFLMLQTPDIDTLYVAYQRRDPATRRAVDAAVQSAIGALKARALPTSLEEPAEELAAALLHYIERSRGSTFNGLGSAATQENQDTPRPVPRRSEFVQYTEQIGDVRRDTLPPS